MIRSYLILLFASLAIAPLSSEAQNEPGKNKPVKAKLGINKKDGKNKDSGRAEPPRDPALAEFGIYAKDAATAKEVDPVDTTLPLKLEKGVRIGFVGNTLLDRAQDFAYFETMIHQANPGAEIKIRNFAWSADEVDLQPRPDNFATVSQHLAREKVDVIFAAFGFNESFRGEERVDEFKARLTTYLDKLKRSAFNGTTGPRIVLISPTANENAVGVKGADLNNERLAVYTKAMAEVAASLKVGFANVFDATRSAMDDPDTDLTINGVHMNERGYEIFSEKLFSETFGKSAPKVDEEIRAVLVDKNKQYFRRYRPLNTFYYVGGRNKSYGYLDFLPAMRNFEMMTDNREARAQALAEGKEFTTPVDDSNLPELGEVGEGRGANEWLTPKDELAAFDIDPRFEVNLFASEEEFPEIACPIQMRWDSRGRLWVSCSTTYPHVYPGKEPDDKIVILEDTDKDGKADKSTIFADDVHIPLSFELTENGIYVSEEPHFSLLEDTDGDDKADKRTRLLTGFGCEDSHHALHDFVWTPGGELLFRESIFHNSQVETAYGPIRAKNSAWFTYRPSNQKVTTFGNYPNTNPWGVTFDDWGHHVASHPIFAAAFHSQNPPYPQQQPKAAGIPAYSGVCGHEFVDFPMWPEELQGGMIKARYKPTNRIEIHKWVKKEDHWIEEYQSDLLFSKNLSFIPVDLRYGPRGAMYICDWYNPIKGHAQYSLRDSRRDRKSGRIWRIFPKGATLQDPPKIGDASVDELAKNLERREYRYRYWTRRELKTRDRIEVAAALDRWVEGLDPADDRYRHHQIEAVWAYRTIEEERPGLLTEILSSDNADARAAATKQLRYWYQAIGKEKSYSLLEKSATDPDGIVRMEAIIAANYLATPEALAAISGAFSLPMGNHLKFAAQCSLMSANLAPFWQGNETFAAAYPAVTEFAKSWDKHAKLANTISTKSSKDSNFDSQKDLKTVEISCVPERMLFTKTKFKVKTAQPVKLIFTNPDATQHNLVIVKPGAVQEVGMAGNEMAKDPSGIKKHFIPESDKILHHTKLLDPETGEVLRFRAPETPGVYPYVCTFPGHWIIMKGEMVVE
ncbi:MAG: GDSL-type esterase/lipase family protein [Verrucomicrobiales bacterium]|nr:GDSL-type esterase/lipase family protein [Verrucomicrobiales bacterium]